MSFKYSVCQKRLFRFAELFVAVFHKKFKTESEKRSAKFELTFYKANGSALFTLPEMHQQCVPSPRHFEVYCSVSSTVI